MKRSANGRNDDAGTYVNREPVDAVLLYDGDEIQIGKFRVVFLTRPTTGVDTVSQTA